ncbi:quinone oxidoreductase PIG3 [Zea mays]|uniref:quinone oxidoreductase PIG3 n=1 Tax=Zea mays TaxID=4577 RepID=UPI0016525706|nr:quinone oxidoreductase PIG3 [Zea mays]
MAMWGNDRRLKFVGDAKTLRRNFVIDLFSVYVILDNIGGSYLQRNLNSLGVDGRLFIIGFQGGIAAEVNLQAVLARRLTIQAAGLRNKSLANKAEIVSEVEKNVWPAVTAGKVKPVIYKTFPLCEAAEAHRLMEATTHIGKILLLP